MSKLGFNVGGALFIVFLSLLQFVGSFCSDVEGVCGIAELFISNMDFFKDAILDGLVLGK
jgi:hypothetical protein